MLVRMFGLTDRIPILVSSTIMEMKMLVQLKTNPVGGFHIKSVFHIKSNHIKTKNPNPNPNPIYYPINGRQIGYKSVPKMRRYIRLSFVRLNFNSN